MDDNACTGKDVAAITRRKGVVVTWGEVKLKQCRNCGYYRGGRNQTVGECMKYGQQILNTPIVYPHHTCESWKPKFLVIQGGLHESAL